MLFRRPDSPNWHSRVHVDGKCYRASMGTSSLTEARKKEMEFTADIVEDRVKGKHLWTKAAARHLAESEHLKSYPDIKSSVSWLGRHLQGMAIEDIGLAEVATLKQTRMAEGVSNRTVNATLQVLNSILKKAVEEWGWMDRRPKVKFLPLPRGRVRYITREEADRIGKHLPNWLWGIYEFSLQTGLRHTNVVRLKWEHVDWSARLLRIPAESTKNSKPLHIPISDVAWSILANQSNQHKVWVFTKGGSRVERANGREWSGAVARAGIDNFRWHDIRHTWASWHVQNGTPLEILRDLGGWSTIDMVLRYAHLSPNHLSAYTNLNVRGSNSD